MAGSSWVHHPTPADGDRTRVRAGRPKPAAARTLVEHAGDLLDVDAFARGAQLERAGRDDDDFQGAGYRLHGQAEPQSKFGPTMSPARDRNAWPTIPRPKESASISPNTRQRLPLVR